MERGQFTFYRSFYDALLSMQKKDREPVIMAICAYALDGELPELSGTPAVAFSLVKPTLDTGRRKAENGKLGGQAESKSKANGSKKKATASKPKQTASKKEKEREGEIEKEKEIENDSYNPPTPLEKAMDDFAEMRKSLRKPLSDRARELTYKKLEELAPGDEQTQIAILNQSIQRGWQGVFPLKEEEKKTVRNGLPVEVKPLKGGDDAERLERLMGLK